MARLLLFAVLGGLVLKALIGSLEPRFVFFPYKGEDRNPSSLGIPYREVRLTTSDGEDIVAWQLEPDHPIADVVYFHGNGGNLSVWLPVLAALHHHGLRVLALDYRGYGKSSGSPSEEGVYRDAEATVQHVRAQRASRRSTHEPPNRRAGEPAEVGRPLIFWGRSLGGPIAASATRTLTPDGLILESTFADKAAVVATQPVLRLLNVFGSYRFSTLDLLHEFRNPVLVMHGGRDSIVPIALGRTLFERLQSPKQFVIIPGADHNDFFDATNGAYWTPVLQFITGLNRS